MNLPIDRQLLEAPTRLILENYRRLLGHDLVDLTPHEDAVASLFAAPCAVLAALGSFGSDHLFCYANQTALTLFETTWEALIGLPSSASAEPVHREERRQLLDEVGRHGFIENYSGVRISRRGRRFRIEEATVFNLQDASGRYVGQAATFSRWQHL